MISLSFRTKSAFQFARSHIQSEKRYRFYPVYSLLLVSVVWVQTQWPMTDQLVRTWMVHPWIISLDICVQQLALYLALMLASVGLMRSGWTPKIISGLAVYEAIRLLLSTWIWYDGMGLYLNVSWYLFDKPVAWLQRLSGGDEFASTGYYAAGLFVVWLLLRPLAMLGWRRLKRVEGWLLDRYPAMKRLDRPVI